MLPAFTRTPYLILRAAVRAGFAALILSTHVFVAVDLIRAKVLQTATPATTGLARATTADFPRVDGLQPPFALIARINSQAAGTSSFNIAVDGAPVCGRDVASGGSRRLDCAVTGEWNPKVEHEVTIQGPPTGWTLEYLELATHHGNTDGLHYLVVLPASSDRYIRPATGWVIATWFLLTAAILLLPAPAPLPRWIGLPYRVVAGTVVLELSLSMCSQWLSDYRIVFSAGTFTRLLILLLAPRLWVLGRSLAQAGASFVAVRPMVRRMVGLAVALVLLGVSGATAWQRGLKGPWKQAQIRWEQFQINRHVEQARARLFAELQPVKLANCEFKRFGEPNDGGYVLCANLLTAVQSGYSYGVSGYDQWGCDVSRGLNVPVHEYDCFNLAVPVCSGGRTVFHGECVGGATATIEGRLFDTPENQFAKNGDGAKRVVVKMDVEGAEWDTLLQASDAVLKRIDQLTIELHGVRESERFTAVIVKLKKFFYVANVHFNNFACQEGIGPFPAEVYEVLFVNKSVGVLGGGGPAGAPAGVTAPNILQWKDCQSLADLPPVRPPVR